jgi:soluble lytic murein transglycosylase
MLATARNESLFDPAVRSRAGALGWLQIMPFHYTFAARQPGRAHWSHAATSLAKATQLMSSGAQRYGADPYRMLAAYNAGPKAVDRWDRQLGGDADRATFLAWIGYAETRRYVEKVLIDREIYDWILSEGAAAPTP